MSKTSVRGAQAVTDTSLPKKKPFISVLDQNSMRSFLRRPRRDAARYKLHVGGARVRTGDPVRTNPAPDNQLFIVMDTGSTNLSGIQMETIQDLMPQPIELALLQLLMQQPGSGPAMRESLWSFVSGEVAHVAPASESESKQPPVSEQPLGQRHKFKVATAAQLREKVLARGEWLSSQEVSENAGYQNANSSGQPNKWKKAGKIFAIAVEGRDLYPTYALGVDGKPLPQMKEVLSLLSPHRQSLAIASWFASANSWLGGKTPMDEIAKNPQGVLKAAQMEAAPIEHG